MKLRKLSLIVSFAFIYTLAILALSAAPVGTTTPTPTATLTPAPTLSPSLTPSATLIPTPTLSPSLTPPATLIPTPTLSPSLTPSATSIPTPTLSPSLTPSATSIPTPVTWPATSAHLVRLGIPVAKGDAEIKRSQCIAQSLVLGLPTPSYSKRSLSQVQRVAVMNAVQLLLPKKSMEGLNVSLACQMAYFVRGGKVIRVLPVSTGRPGYSTHIGTWKVNWQVNGWHESNEYKGAMMYRPKFFYKGEALHGLTYDSATAPYPASHGCVRAHRADMDWIWRNWKSADRVRVY